MHEYVHSASPSQDMLNCVSNTVACENILKTPVNMYAVGNAPKDSVLEDAKEPVSNLV